MRIIGFRLMNLTNDKQIDEMRLVTINDITRACDRYKIEPADIGIEVLVVTEK